MIRGMYTAASGMVANFKRQMIVANNLANVSTTGFKQDNTAAADFENLLLAQDARVSSSIPQPIAPIGQLGLGTEVGQVQLDLTQGPITETGNPLDLAISGPGFFAVQTPSGTLYTRDGTFVRDASGRLVREDGSFLLGQNGPLQVGEGDIVVSGDGTVAVGGQVAGQVRLVDFDPQERLLKVGQNYLAPENPSAAARPVAGSEINQGFLERSNVDLNQTVTDMMSAMRSYEASQKLVLLQDQTLERTVNDVGKV